MIFKTWETLQGTPDMWRLLNLGQQETRLCVSWRGHTPLKGTPIAICQAQCLSQKKGIRELGYTQEQPVWDTTPSPGGVWTPFLRTTNLTVSSPNIVLLEASSPWAPFQLDASRSIQKQRDRWGGTGRKELKSSQSIWITSRPQALTPSLILLLNWNPSLQPKWSPTTLWTAQSPGAGESHTGLWLFKWENSGQEMETSC